MRREHRPVLITDAERSQDDQLRAREIRYVLMMSIRAISLVVAAVLVSAHAPLLWLWIPICLAGMLLVPWFAVILANDRPPKSRHRIAYYLHRERHGGDGRRDGGNGGTEPEALPRPEAVRVIDADE